ncbi:SDR family NAD(P)-dependent oxidoreductase [Methylobacterium sp. WL122]|nr:SDR family NAD(P)-dependent oxidoreductase [Methylobacterium sp. WL122]
MARIFITGSSTGLGLMAGQLMIEQGHEVVLHGRDARRSDTALREASGAVGVVTGDLSLMCGIREVAEQVNRLGRFDAVIHNAGVGYREPRRIDTEDGLPHVFAVNTMAPYLLTVLIERPERLVYLSSGLHHGAGADLDDLLWRRRRWQGLAAYAESKLHDVLLAFAVARLWPDVLSNALEPGWVATRMGGAGASDDLAQGHLTQAWLATGDDALARSTGRYFYHRATREPDPVTAIEATQDALLIACERVSGVTFPR